MAWQPWKALPSYKSRKCTSGFSGDINQIFWKRGREFVTFNIASEASYVYIWSGQKLLKMPKRVHFGEFLKTWSLRSNSVTRQVNSNWIKIDGKCQNSNATFWVFSNNVLCLKHFFFCFSVTENTQCLKINKNVSLQYSYIFEAVDFHMNFIFIENLCTNENF